MKPSLVSPGAAFLVDETTEPAVCRLDVLAVALRSSSTCTLTLGRQDVPVLVQQHIQVVEPGLVILGPALRLQVHLPGPLSYAQKPQKPVTITMILL